MGAFFYSNGVPLQGYIRFPPFPLVSLYQRQFFNI
jgi:hypothetical protein